MEQLAPVDLDLVAMKRVVSSTGGCITWGGSVQLSPADDILIRVERALDILEFQGRSEDELGVSEIGTATGLSATKA